MSIDELVTILKRHMSHKLIVYPATDGWVHGLSLWCEDCFTVIYDLTSWSL